MNLQAVEAVTDAEEEAEAMVVRPYIPIRDSRPMCDGRLDLDNG